MKMPPPIATKFTKLVLTILAITILGIILSFVSQDHTLLMLSAGVAVAGGVKIIDYYRTIKGERYECIEGTLVREQAGYQTQRAIHHHVAFVHTDQSCFLSTHLFDQGYRIFLHFKSGTVTEVGRGENPALPVRIIRENMNLEAPLLAGLLGKLTE